MTSAQNLRRPLSGNNLICFGLVLVALISCAAPKHASKPTQPPPLSEKEEQVKTLEPSPDAQIPVPLHSAKVDTLKWTEDPSPPLVTDNVEEPEKPVVKRQFNISLLMPFTSTSQFDIGEHIDAKLNRWLQYYAGVQLASEEINGQGDVIRITALEAGDTPVLTEEALMQEGVAEADVIVGPYVKEGIERTATFGLKHESMVISPWLPAFTITDENPYFIQTLPGLNTHAEAITKYLAEDWPGRKIFLVARNIPAEVNRLSLFKKNPELRTEDLIIEDKSAELIHTDLKTLLAPEGTIFVLPYYAKADESFVNSFLRKLHADKELEEIMVIGFPQWIGFSNLNANYMENLSVHLSTATFTDMTHQDYASFRSRFFDRFHFIPDLQAFLGYDLIQWIAATLRKGGKDSLISPMASWHGGLASGFDIRPVFRSGAASNAEMKTPLYYENAHIRIIRYKDLDFHLVR